MALTKEDQRIKDTMDGWIESLPQGTVKAELNADTTNVFRIISEQRAEIERLEAIEQEQIRREHRDWTEE